MQISKINTPKISAYSNNLNSKSLDNNYLKVENSEKLTKTLDCLASISFGSLYSKITPGIPKHLEKLMSAEIPVDFDVYKFMKTNPTGFYLRYGRDVNMFLRRGTFDPVPEFKEDDVPEVIRGYVKKELYKRKCVNRTIFESIKVLDSMISSKTTEPMVVYRDAPKSWMKSAENGFLTDKAYCSVSTVRGASAEGIVSNGSDNFTYQIYLPANTSFADLRSFGEAEMVLGRNSVFKIIEPGVLALQPKK